MEELLNRARRAHDPTAHDRARVRAKLDARIAAGAVMAGGSAKAMSFGWSALMKAMLPVLAVGTVGGYLLWHRAPPVGPEPDPVPISQTVMPTPVVAPIVASEAMTETAAPPATAVKPPRPARPAKGNGAGDLEAETLLITDAQGAIQRGDFASALAKLDEHEKTYPAGVLTEERIAARIVALCGAGRQPEAKALAKTFLARYPTSPLAPRVKSSCAAP